MEVPLFLLADFANSGAGGKLNMLGVFNEIHSPGFPAIQRMFFLVIRVEATIGEFDEDHDLRILFIDEDGHQIEDLSGKIKIERPKDSATGYSDLVVQINNLKLEKPGRYEFRLVIDKDVKRILPLNVRKVDSPVAE